MRRVVALLLALLLAAAAAWAQDVQPVPALSARVIDATGTLAPAQRQALEDKLAAFEKQAGSQFVILVVATTAPEDIVAYAQRVADQWKIGRREVGDGLLIVVAKNDRAVRIEVAKKLEGAVPDLAASRIIEGVVVPAFRQGDFAGGLNAAVDQIEARIRGEA
ncbi:MAG: TPM domain-containing protein, partial [Burkholderiales bacterium]|nr:TPM domain-containing protein [Burkholderiales bacterium]